MRLEVNKYLFDIKTSIDSIFEFLGENRDFIYYQSNKKLRRAVERELEIIGEALNKILKILLCNIFKNIAKINNIILKYEINI